MQRSKKRLIGAHCSVAGGLAEGPRRGHEVGCNVIQIFTKNSNQWESAPLLLNEVSAFQKSLVENGIELAFAHAGYLINLASPEKAVHDISIKSMRQELERAEALELPFVVVHPGSHKGAGELVGILQVVESIKMLLDDTEGFKVHILLETTAGQGRSLGHRFEHFKEIFSRLDEKYLKRVGVCLDTAHVFAAGYDISTEAGYEDLFSQFKKFVGFDMLKVFHLNDTVKALGSKVDRHENLGEGEIGLNAFKRIVRDDRFQNVPLVIETPKGNSIANDVKNIKLLKKFAGEK